MSVIVHITPETLFDTSNLWRENLNDQRQGPRMYIHNMILYVLYDTYIVIVLQYCIYDIHILARLQSLLINGVFSLQVARTVVVLNICIIDTTSDDL